MALLDVLRAPGVKRWQIVDVNRVQSMAEHTFGVIAIALELVNRIYAFDLDPEAFSSSQIKEAIEKWRAMREAVMLAAFVHDLPEVVTGDIPVPTKRVLGLYDSLRIIEDKLYFADCTYGDFNDEVREIVNAADIIEAYWFLKNYRNTNSVHANSVFIKIQRRVDAIPMAKALVYDLERAQPLELDDMMGVKDIHGST